MPTAPARTVIVGGPKTGKTTLARKSAKGRPVRHTDDILDEVPDWSEQSEVVASWMQAPGPWVIEGTSTARALRKALAASSGPPCDLVVVLVDPQVRLTKGQKAMLKGTMTVLEGIVDDLTDRGVVVEFV